MTRRGRWMVTLAVAVVVTVSAAAVWLVRGKTVETDATQQPAATMTPIGTFPTEATLHYDGEVALLQRLSLGREWDLHPVQGMTPKDKAPHLVSQRARRARPYDASMLRHGASALFFVDESAGDGTGYDRLYVDRNADGVYEPSESVGLMADAPVGGARPLSSGRKYLVFEPFEIQVSPEEAPRSVVARLGIGTDGSATRLLVGEGLRRAKVTLGGVECSVVMSTWYPADYDEPGTRRVIEYGPGQVALYGRDTLWSMNGEVYRLSTAPSGKMVTVEEYFGDAGTIAIEMAGAWKGVSVREISMKGGNPLLTVAGSGADLCAAGELLEQKGEFDAPVGRYHPVEMSLVKGAASCHLSDMSDYGEEHAKHVQVSGGGRTRLALTARPEVTFTKPEKGAHFRRGEKLEIEVPVVKCTELELYISSIFIPSEDADAVGGHKWSAPQVVIKDSSGAIVARGNTWRIPREVKVGERLTVEFTLDTGELWGTITGKREVIVVE